MAKLIKNHWARLIILTAAGIQFLASLEGFFWPKIFWDFLTKNLDGAVKPFPALQTMNLVFSLFMFAFEYPLVFLPKIMPSLHRSIEFRLVLIPVFATTSILMYQSTNAAIYYLIGTGVYFWALSDGEIVCPVPWTLPKRPGTAGARGARV